MSRPIIIVVAVVLLSLCFRTVSASPLLSSNQLVFVNVDHAPMGACSTIAYGHYGQPCGIGTSNGEYPYSSDNGGGVVIGLSRVSGLQLLPFVAATSNVADNATFFPNTAIQRALTPGTDEYLISGTGLSFTHYSPAWLMPDLNAASLDEKRRFFLPATWLVFTVTNNDSAPEDFYFGLPVAVTPKTFANGAYQGVVLGEAALAVQTGSCELLTGSALTSVFNHMNQGFALHLSVPAGQTRTLMVAIAFYRNTVVDSRTGSKYFYTTLFSSVDSVFDAAFARFGDAQLRCQQLAGAMSNAGLNPYRQFLASYALHSYMADTACLIDPQGVVHWWEMEGYFNFINTFDLTVDHAFYAACMLPWALRNVLDGFSGALSGPGYSYEIPLYSPTGTQVSTQGFSFSHDMGLWPTSGTGPAYGSNMGQEELQAWILSAGLYWSHTADHAWLTNNAGLLQRCLNSMLLRDNTNSAARDGITKNVNSGEITTYDNLDASLQRPAFSARLAVRNWASYLALEAMFRDIDDNPDGDTCHDMAGVAAQTIVDRWNTYHPTLGYIPALLDGDNTAATTPIIEGLAYPAAMGLTNAIDRTAGPYAPMLQALSNHLAAVLVPSKCLPWGWLMTSANIIAWQSKVFICQYAAEVVLGITNNSVNGSIDQIHASIEIEAGPREGCVDATDGTGRHGFAGGVHYPRAVSTALWWLNPSNNPSFPIATSAPPAPAVSAVAGDHQVLLLWPGVPLAKAYDLKRALVSGGPYTPLATGVSGASYQDFSAVNGTTFYYVLTATNDIGESLPSPEVSATPIPLTGTNLTASIVGVNVQISWPTDYIGWVLQTNRLGLARLNGWGDVPASRTNSQMTFPLTNPSIPNDCFRLRHP